MPKILYAMTAIVLTASLARGERCISDQELTEKVKSILSKEFNHDSIPEKTAMPRTCNELRRSDPNATTGMHYIDPDGTGVGDEAILVHCNMSEGTTSVSHDSEATIQADSCIDPGCYSRTVLYNATMRQMLALAELSSSCRQFFKFDCFSVPFEFNRVPQAWWNDRNDQVHYYWAGNYDTEHTCQCGLDATCVSSIVRCNCDTDLAYNLTDEGYITSKDQLPVAKLNFGRTISVSSYGRHTLGKFECSGEAAVQEMPASCADLWRIGHSLNGLYSVKKGDDVHTVYCDFKKMPFESGMETDLGIVQLSPPPAGK